MDSQIFGYIVGVVFGDGHVRVRKNPGRTSGEIVLKVNDLDFAINFKEMLEKWSGRVAKIGKDNKGRDCTFLYSIHHAKIVRDFSIQDVLKFDLIFKHSFLRGLFDSDGGIIGKNLKKRRISKRWLHLSNSNIEIMNTVCMILDEIGIKYSMKSRVHSGFGSQKTQYELKIYNFKGINYYYNNIGFSIARKQNILKKVVESYNIIT